MRIPLIAANWKMHKSLSETAEFLSALSQLSWPEDREVLVCPPFTALHAAGQAIKGGRILLGAQNAHFESKGAFTGEIALSMLQECGCTHVILGHSERRHVFGETDELIQKKLRSALDADFIPILCVGEKKEQRDAGRTEEVVGKQLSEALQGIRDAGGLVIAYEPVWAIGTGDTASPEQAQEAHAFIRERVAALLGKGNAEKIRILYGGSVRPENAGELMAQRDIDGCLVGGASLDAESFSRIILFDA